MSITVTPQNGMFSFRSEDAWEKELLKYLVASEFQQPVHLEGIISHVTSYVKLLDSQGYTIKEEIICGAEAFVSLVDMLEAGNPETLERMKAIRLEEATELVIGLLRRALTKKSLHVGNDEYDYKFDQMELLNVNKNKYESVELA